MNTFRQVIIFSAELSTNRHEKNRQLTENLKYCLDDCHITYNVGMGCYNGDKETCFVTLPKNEDEINTLKDFAFKVFDQESIFYQDSNGLGHLIFNDGKSKRVGSLREVSPKRIEQLNNYTVLNNKVYTTEY